jgi:hypothetical protein
VLTSAEAQSRLGEALKQAGMSEEVVLTRLLKEPHTGFQEVSKLITDQEILNWITKAKAVIVNLTGGTTVLQYAAERVAKEARDLGLPVQRVALIDRRTPQEQQAQPYLLGEIVQLDADRGAPTDAAD